MTYDDQNIFAKILRGEIPCYKAPARGILDVEEDDFAEVARTAKRIAVAAAKAFNADGIIVQQFSEPASGQVVLHLHMHVMPVRQGVALLPAQTRNEDRSVLEAHAAKMIAALGS
jgi:histidine triad (HIT) family protein